MDKQVRIRKTENIKDYRKNYYEVNKDKIKENFKQWTEQNDPYAKLLCPECNVYINRCSMSKHRKTLKHKKMIEINLHKSLELSNNDNEINSDSDLNLK